MWGCDDYRYGNHAGVPHMQALACFARKKFLYHSGPALRAASAPPPPRQRHDRQRGAPSPRPPHTTTAPGFPPDPPFPSSPPAPLAAPPGGGAPLGCSQ